MESATSAGPSADRPPRAVRGGLIARLPLEHRLPLVIGTFVLIAIAALVAVAYAEMRRTSLRTGSERLTAVTTQLRDLFQQSSRQIRGQLAPVAKEQSILAFTRAQTASTRERALAALKATQTTQVIATEIRDSTGKVLLASTSGTLRVDSIAVADVLPSLEPTDSAVAGGFRLVNDTLVFPAAIAVAGAPGHYVVQWRRLVGSRRSREQMSRLVGSDAELFLGTASTGHWTNLERVVPPPPFATRPGDTVQHYASEDGTDHIASMMPVIGTPWHVAVGFSVANLLAPVNSFLRRVVLLALVALAIALALTWVVSRRITRQVDESTTALKSALDQLQDAQDSLVRRERLAMLGQLSSGVGHELRNPLGVMTNAVYYLKAVLPTAPEKVREYLDILQQQITLSEKIVSDLLDFARSKPPQRRPFSLAEVATAQVSRLGALNGFTINTHLPKDLPPVLADQTQVGQIVLNLLTNAVQAMDRTGTIDVRAQSSGKRVHLDVSDTGPGIPAANLEKIFEPLFTTKARGIGLGLAVSRTLARANDGELTAANLPTRGASFRLTLEAAGAST
jgi:signal transduction histidine kinase